MTEKAMIQSLAVGPLQANCYLFSSPEGLETAIIDPGGDAERIIADIERRGLKPTCIVNTHGHPDHTAANAAIRKRYGIPLLIHKNDAPLLAQSDILTGIVGFPFDSSPPPDRLLSDSEDLEIGGLKLKVLHTPGHSSGSICLFYAGQGNEEPILFSGDTVFEGSVGRTDLPDGSHETLIHSIKNKIMTLPDNTRILSGHGPETTLSREKRSNPFFKV